MWGWHRPMNSWLGQLTEHATWLLSLKTCPSSATGARQQGPAFYCPNKDSQEADRKREREREREKKEEEEEKWYQL